ncbi:hypothetical protein LKD70_02845 [Ruminococcus sp. CLA-AA-H200]|uniref:DUF2178 domain-containing protein n=1 Tax=Ruminococcus turbiniformis TaxID=2881258 RepID=A0ABS8FW55_9FIRM|nr:hypothetical protein [Ruminococcus turbiniformis]MCC2253387.1 hypothetical protein [Ruminococcus turbiniformis]
MDAKGMSVFAVLFLVFLLVLVILDIAMVISLARSGDERRNLIVWKASSYTLLGTAGCMILRIIENIVRSESMSMNPFTMLGTMAILYFVLLLVFRRKYT